MDPRMKYADLRAALHWAENAKEEFPESETISYVYGYLKAYCNSIKLEEK